MNNPWLALPESAQYVTDEDWVVMKEHHHKLKGDFGLRLDLLPEPFLGNPNAPVVLLSLNPGFCEKDVLVHQNPVFIKASRANLEHKPCETPFFLLGKDIDAPGNAWWRQKLGKLIAATSFDVVTNGVCCIEYFPYHSKSYKPLGATLPTQQYGFHLVREALKREAVIIIMRSVKLWHSAVPDLAGRSYQLKNPQNVTVSLNNCMEGFWPAVHALTTTNPADHESHQLDSYN